MAIAVALMVAFTCVALSSVVVWAAPLKLSTELLLKFVPVTVKSKAGPPAVAFNGARLIADGKGLFTARPTAGAVVPPPGAGFTTVIARLPAAATSAAVRSARTCVPLS